MYGIEINQRALGVNWQGNNKTTINIWAPLLENLQVVTENKVVISLAKEKDYWKAVTDKLPPGTKYKLRINNGEEFPDPTSHYQPDGPHGFSQVVEINRQFHTKSKPEIPLHDYIIYELHTGTFSEKENFEGIISKLDHLIDLGITAIELMPVAQFSGKRNWGYDGVDLFSVHNSYGGPEGLLKLIDTCHSKNLAVILDVVYNHIGPEGNYLGKFGPYFTEKYKTPWGAALNYDDSYSDGVRRFFIENALMWFRDYNIDALRLDAIHAITDFSANHILKDIKLHVDELSRITKQNYYLIAESDFNDVEFITPLEKNGCGMDAQWMDDFHHSIHVSVTGENNGYYMDFNGLTDLAKSYNNAFVYDGKYSEFRKKTFGSKTNHTEGKNFVVYTQNHDQVGNRQMGDRLSSMISFEKQKMIATALMFSPFIPMLFMGEEWGATSPFQYFVSHTDEELSRLVREGRKAEFKSFHGDAETPDPVLEKTFFDSKLKWEDLNNEQSKLMLTFYRDVISLRKKINKIYGTNRKNINAEPTTEVDSLLIHRWTSDQNIYCALNFSNENKSIKLRPVKPLNIIFDSNLEKYGSSPGTYTNGTVMLKGESAIILSDHNV